MLSYVNPPSSMTSKGSVSKLPMMFVMFTWQSHLSMDVGNAGCSTLTIWATTPTNMTKARDKSPP